MTHFIALPKLSCTKEMAEILLYNVLRIHGFPIVIGSDWGSRFILQFWKEICSRLETTLQWINRVAQQGTGDLSPLPGFSKSIILDQAPDLGGIAHNFLPTGATELTPFQCVLATEKGVVAPTSGQLLQQYEEGCRLGLLSPHCSKVLLLLQP